MNLVEIARFSNVLGAAIWFLGLPLVVIYATPFSTDASYFVFGVLIALLGLATTPIVLAYPGGAPATIVGVVRFLGLVSCVALVVAGTLLLGGSSGILGDKAPSWIEGAAVTSVVGYFAWVVLASYSTRHLAMLGASVFWLGMVAGISLVVPTLTSVLMSVIDQGFVLGNATIPLVVISGLLTWLCLPAWLIALTVRMRAAGRRLVGAGPDRL